MASETTALALVPHRPRPEEGEASKLDALVLSSRTSIRRGLAKPDPTAPASWTCTTLGGCLAELSGASASSSLTLAFSLVLEAQQRSEPAAWITQTDSTFYPPDAAEGGVDLAALSVIRLPGRRQCLRAAEQLVRSGAFGLLVSDLGRCLDLPLAVQTRLAGQALAHRTLILCLTAKTEDERSLGSLVSVRAHAERIHRGDGRFTCRVNVLKDKRRLGHDREQPRGGAAGRRRAVRTHHPPYRAPAPRLHAARRSPGTYPVAPLPIFD